jgi:hypothetical protein
MQQQEEESNREGGQKRDELMEGGMPMVGYRGGRAEEK